MTIALAVNFGASVCAVWKLDSGLGLGLKRQTARYRVGMVPIKAGPRDSASGQFAQ